MQIPDSDGRHPLGALLDDRIAAGGEIARMEMSTPRFWLVVAALAALGAVIVWSALGGGTSILRTIIAAFGLVLIYASARLAITGRQGLVLTGETLTDTRGRELCRVADVARVDRSVLALRPSNGFMIHLKSSAQRAWHPGLWWRFGRRVGVGGLTPAGQGRAMADLLAVLVKDKEQSGA